MNASGPAGFHDDSGGAPSRDPWILGGLLLLALLTIAAVLVYRSAPRTLAEARTGSWLAASPNAYGANLARARERYEAALREAAAGNDSLAAATDSVAAEHAWRAAGLATEADDRREALRLWSQATLHRSDRLRIRGTGAGFRPDDNALLQQALELVQRVDSLSPFPGARARADTLRAEIQRQLRPGPLEWLPR